MCSGDLSAQTDQQVYQTARPAADTGDAAATDVTYFYKNPSPARVAGILRWMNTVTGPRHDEPMVGFMAAVFARFPADIDTMIPKGLSPHMMQLVAISLQLAGQDAKAQSIAEMNKRVCGSSGVRRRRPPWLGLRAHARNPKERKVRCRASVHA